MICSLCGWEFFWRYTTKPVAKLSVKWFKNMSESERSDERQYHIYCPNCTASYIEWISSRVSEKPQTKPRLYGE